MPITSRIAAVSIMVAATALAACEGGARQEAPPRDRDEAVSGFGGAPDEAGRISDLVNLNSGGLGGGGGLTAVNRHLWRASLDTLAFLPLSSTDPFTGVIATDWGASPETPEERFKVTAYVNSPRLAANSLQVAVFREIRSPEGAWVTAPVSGVTARRLEDAILVRARQIRIEERQGQG